MGKKRLDLSGMYVNTRQIQDNNKIDTRQIQNKEEHGKYAAYRQAEEAIEKCTKEKSPATEPKKINMAFSDEIYDIIKDGTKRYGVTAAYYINELIRNADSESIRKWYDKLLVKPSKAFIPRIKGQASKRIFIKFDADTYHKIAVGAEQYNMTLTQYVNMVMELNTR